MNVRILTTINKSILIFQIILICLLSGVNAQNLSGIKGLKFTRQGVKRFIFEDSQSIHLAGLEPENIIGLTIMHPVESISGEKADIHIEKNIMQVESKQLSQTGIWFGGFNPFATYTINVESCVGNGAVGFEFSGNNNEKQFFVSVNFNNERIEGINLSVLKNLDTLIQRSVSVMTGDKPNIQGKLILQMLGSGFVLYLDQGGLPKVIGQADFNKYIDLRKIKYINTFQSKLYVKLFDGNIRLGNVSMDLTTGMGEADIRAITYENGDPMLDKGRIWYTMSIRGRSLPHHIQGVFSLDPTVFDLKFEGIIVFDRNDGLLRNEIASHIFYDRKQKVWRGITTGFSAYANPKKEKKQLLAIESYKDPRFGFSIMKAKPLGVVGDIEDPHILFDEKVSKWRILTCKNTVNGYRAVLMESDYWDNGYHKIAGPVTHNSTGTSIQKINDKRYCFSGSSEREIFIYSYPDLKEVGTLAMDLPPWDNKCNTRIWPNVVELPDGYPFKYIALMMDRFNYPGMKGSNWTYGALYFYHGFIDKNK